VRLFQFSSGLFLSFWLASVWGCGTTGLPNSVPVKGTITLDGKPLENGTVMFVPAGQGQEDVAIGVIKDGHFAMATSVSSPGVIMGKYKIQVEAYGQIAAGAAPGSSGMPPVPPSIIPAKYRSSKTSGFEVEVTKNLSPVVLELKST